MVTFGTLERHPEIYILDMKSRLTHWAHWQTGPTHLNSSSQFKRKSDSVGKISKWTLTRNRHVYEIGRTRRAFGVGSSWGHFSHVRKPCKIEPWTTPETLVFQTNIVRVRNVWFPNLRGLREDHYPAQSPSERQSRRSESEG